MSMGRLRNGSAFVAAPAMFVAWLMVTNATGFGVLALGMLVLVIGAVVWPVVDHVVHTKHSRHYRKFAEQHGWSYISRTMRYTGVFRGFPFGTGTERQQLD